MTDQDVMDELNNRILAQQLENLKMQRAHENGEKESAIKIAKKLLEKGNTISEIADITGLEETEIMELKD